MRFPVNPRPLYMLTRDDSNVFNATLINWIKVCLSIRIIVEGICIEFSNIKK